MLTELKVSQFAIIESLQISFHSGLNIISGETGAGKSVLLKSLGLLMGAKSSSDMIRSQAPQAFVEGHFDLNNRNDIQERLKQLDIPLEGEALVVRRVIGPQDKNKVYLNGTLSTVTVLKEIVAPMIELAGRTIPLIEMTSQHENKNLLSKNYQLDLLDHSAGLWQLRKQYEKKWTESKQLLESISAKKSKSLNSQHQLDFLIFQRDEIAHLDMSPGEDLELESKVKQIKNYQKIIHFVENAEQILYSDDQSVLQKIQKVIQRSNEIQIFDSVLKEKIQPLTEAKILIEDTLFNLRDHINGLCDISDLESLEVKLNQLRKLQKKYGPSLDDILKNLIKIENEIHEIENCEKDLELLVKKEKEVQIILKKIAEELHEKRKFSAATLQKAVNDELLDLNMKGFKFDIRVELFSPLQQTGASEVEFMCQTSVKDQARSLAKFASGGELSRILLALKCVTGTSTVPRSYLFDEVDTGVSGPTAQKVGNKLHQIAQGQQVICVTHLPQVAAYADHHFLIQKSQKSSNSLAMIVTELNAKEKINELARLISGEKITKTSLAHAKELLKLYPNSTSI
jgi:DNA repair protein RecN (Recombination protein N)